MNLKELDLPPGADVINKPRQLAKVANVAPLRQGMVDYKNKPNYLGRGAFGGAFSTKGGAEVTKISFWADAPNYDAYVKYLKFCLANYGNMYLPRIYGIKYYRIPKKKTGYDDDTYFYYVNMEPLVELHKLAGNQQWSLLNRLIELPADFTPETAEKVIDSWRTTYGVSLLSDVVETIGELLDGKPSSRKHRLVIKDESLLETIKLLKKYISSVNRSRYKVTHDIKMANLMARITPYGPQLVITDPIA